MQPWVDANDLAAEHGMTPEVRLEHGVQLAEFPTELAASAAQDASD
jgi:hypothetical protein